MNKRKWRKKHLHSEDNAMSISANYRMSFERLQKDIENFDYWAKGMMAFMDRERQLFGDQFTHNPDSRRICPNKKCGLTYAYFYEEFKYCPVCGSKLK